MRERGDPGVIAAPRSATGEGSVAEEVHARVLRRAAETTAQPLAEILYETVYREQQRLAEAGTDARAESDRKFVKGLRRELARGDTRAHGRLLASVLARYTGEIEGHFDPRVYGFATRVLPPALGTLLHGGRPSLQWLEVDDRILLEGDVEGIRRAARRGTVVLVPTHFSNLDSLVLGYAIYRLGLPPFAYGAGLNLFSNPLTGFFMRNLGAFTVDRTKSDPLYLEAVKEYACVLLERGQHLLFFPGGTRSRTGAVESKLKLGFLSRVVTAFAHRLARSPTSGPIFVVPCTLTYPLVLEAASLIEQWLRAEGGPYFVDVRDEFERPRSWLDFSRGLAELDVRVHVHFASPLDPFGNAVDEAGTSRDRAGRPLDPARYLMVDGVVTSDAARDAEYTRTAAARILAACRRGSVALPSTVLAHAVFSRLARRYPSLDLFRLLQVLGPHASVSRAELEPEIDALLAALQAAAARGELLLSPALRDGGRAAVLEQGAATLGTYHREPVIVRRGDVLEVVQPTLLLYYRNRLDGFELPGVSARRASSARPSWSTS